MDMNPDLYRRRAERRSIVIAIIIVIVGGTFWYLSQSGSLKQIASFESSLEKAVVQDVQQQFSAPPPLRSKLRGASATPTQYTLTRTGVIADTNIQRAENGGLPPLAENVTLDQIAKLRLQDMFAKQYFAHV